jgi:hypothetical protein
MITVLRENYLEVSDTGMTGRALKQINQRPGFCSEITPLAGLRAMFAHQWAPA